MLLELVSNEVIFIKPVFFYCCVFFILWSWAIVAAEQTINDGIQAINSGHLQKRFLYNWQAIMIIPLKKLSLTKILALFVFDLENLSNQNLMNLKKSLLRNCIKIIRKRFEDNMVICFTKK